MSIQDFLTSQRSRFTHDSVRTGKTHCTFYVALISFAFTLAIVLAVSTDAYASEGMTTVAENDFVQVLQYGDNQTKPSWNYLITHGLGGTRENDRFAQLAGEIKSKFPNANVYLLDWSPVAKKRFLGMPAVWYVSSRIDLTSKLAAAAIDELRIDLHYSTFIGESFGNFVNTSIAQRLGVVSRILFFNPANELGGYPLPNLIQAADSYYSFHTISGFDTQQQLSDRDVRLNTPAGMNALAAHTFGIKWLKLSLQRGDFRWILFEQELPDATGDSFSGTVSVDGEFNPAIVRRPLNQEARDSDDEVVAITDQPEPAFQVETGDGVSWR